MLEFGLDGFLQEGRFFASCCEEAHLWGRAAAQRPVALLGIDSPVQIIHVQALKHGNCPIPDLLRGAVVDPQPAGAPPDAHTKAS